VNVARNTVILAAAMAVYSAVLQLTSAVSSITFVLVTGVRGLLGLGPAIFLVASALTALPAGRAMDRFGRRPVIACGYLAATAGCCLTALATNIGSAPILILGFMLTGAASGVALLIRTAAGDMYPPERRARGISYVLFGSVFGAILGPSVFGPLFSGRELDAAALTVPWLAAGAISLVALVLVLFVRPDPKRIAEMIGAHEDERGPAAPLREIVVRPGVRPAMLAALASFGVMVSVMNLSGYVVVEHHHHTQGDVFPIIGAHRRRLEHLVRRRHRAVGRRRGAVRARAPGRVQRPALGPVRRRAGAARRLRARLDRRRRPGARRDRDRGRAGAVGAAASRTRARLSSADQALQRAEGVDVEPGRHVEPYQVQRVLVAHRVAVRAV
jgi:MFS transporter